MYYYYYLAVEIYSKYSRLLHLNEYQIWKDFYSSRTKSKYVLKIVILCYRQPTIVSGHSPARSHAEHARSKLV